MYAFLTTAPELFSVSLPGPVVREANTEVMLYKPLSWVLLAKGKYVHKMPKGYHLPLKLQRTVHYKEARAKEINFTLMDKVAFKLGPQE